MLVCSNSCLQVEMDPTTLSEVVRLQLEDSQELVNSDKGKQHEGVLTDGQLALQTYIAELTNCSATLADRRMAQSIASAVLRDSALIGQVYDTERQLAEDSELARHLAQDNVVPASDFPTDVQPGEMEADPWHDEELLSKVAAKYMIEPDQSPLPALTEDSDSDNLTIAESSRFAARRKNQDAQKLGHCVACGDDKPFFDVARVPCEHEYCRECLAQLFSLSMTDESLYPPRCCNKAIPVARNEFFLPQELVKAFKSKSVELGTKNRTYCYDPLCSTFIAQSSTNGEIGTCAACQKTTCVICKAPSHSGDCPRDDALHDLLDIAETEQWQRCLDCHRLVELETGCNHITCKCNAQFCYVCGSRWKTCQCPTWHEDRLYNRAVQLVDRNAGRRLFQPPRVAHAQPARLMTRPAPVPSQLQSQAIANAPHRLAQTLEDIGSPAQSAWQSDFSDHSDWEEDWESDVALATAPSTTPRLHSPSPPPAKEPAKVLIRRLQIAEAMDRLREDHECEHQRWQWVKGRHQCEECSYVLKEYIFECRQCHLQACNRCRRNRL